MQQTLRWTSRCHISSCLFVHHGNRWMWGRSAFWSWLGLLLRPWPAQASHTYTDIIFFPWTLLPSVTHPDFISLPLLVDSHPALPLLDLYSYCIFLGIRSSYCYCTQLYWLLSRYKSNHRFCNLFVFERIYSSWLNCVQIVDKSLMSSIKLSNFTAVLSSAHFRAVLNSVCVRALSVQCGQLCTVCLIQDYISWSCMSV